MTAHVTYHVTYFGLWACVTPQTVRQSEDHRWSTCRGNDGTCQRTQWSTGVCVCVCVCVRQTERVTLEEVNAWLAKQIKTDVSSHTCAAYSLYHMSLCFHVCVCSSITTKRLTILGKKDLSHHYLHLSHFTDFSQSSFSLYETVSWYIFSLYLPTQKTLWFLSV